MFIIIITTRSIPQVLMSWLIYDHTYGKYGWIGIAIVFAAILLRVGNQFRRYRLKLKDEKAKKKLEDGDFDEKDDAGSPLNLNDEKI